ncbi:hypothetical protein GW17_00061888, partial [Ensete ventricosum]
ALEGLDQAYHVLKSPVTSLSLLHPHYAVVVTVAPAQATTALARRQPLCQGAATPAVSTSTGAVALAGGASAGRLPSYVRRTRSWSPLAGWPRAIICRLLAAAPYGRRAAAGHPRAAALGVWPRAGATPLMAGPGRSRPPLCMWALAAAYRPLAGGREIVYPCILDPDREDEGGQASSSLAVSTRWISTAKLLQSDLATLAQREGGE